MPDSWSGGAAWLVLVATGALVSAMQWWRMRVAARRFELAAERDALGQGYAVITGTVFTDDARPAITLDVAQQGREEHVQRGHFDHEWRETSRAQEVRPFTLRCAEGEVIVEPPKDTRLMDEPDVTRRLALDSRIRRAEIFHGRRVSIEGELVRAQRPSRGDGDYRGQGAVWVLRAWKGTMAISLEPKPSRYTIRIQAWRFTALMLCSLLIFPPLLQRFDIGFPTKIFSCAYIALIAWMQQRARPWYEKKLNQRAGGRLE
jgi:hypothetical protein